MFEVFNFDFIVKRDRYCRGLYFLNVLKNQLYIKKNSKFLIFLQTNLPDEQLVPDS